MPIFPRRDQIPDIADEAPCEMKRGRRSRRIMTGGASPMISSRARPVIRAGSHLIVSCQEIAVIKQNATHSCRGRPMPLDRYPVMSSMIS